MRSKVLLKQAKKRECTNYFFLLETALGKTRLSVEVEEQPVVDLDIGDDRTDNPRQTEAGQVDIHLRSSLHTLQAIHHQREYLQRVRQIQGVTVEQAQQIDNKARELLQLIDRITAPIRRSNRQQHN
jgi:hypothetical protein